MLIRASSIFLSLIFVAIISSVVFAEYEMPPEVVKFFRKNPNKVVIFEMRKKMSSGCNTSIVVNRALFKVFPDGLRGNSGPKGTCELEMNKPGRKQFSSFLVENGWEEYSDKTLYIYHYDPSNR